MLEIDCRICCNCDLKRDLCKLYSADPNDAVAKCSNNGFKGFWPKHVSTENKE